MQPDVAVVGGGIIGLSIAWRAQQRGMDVVVLDAGIDGAWHRAAGMLAPVTEAQFGEEALLRLALESADRYEGFCDELGVELRETGTMVVARDRDEAEALDRLHAFRGSLGLAAERLLPTEARRREGALAPSVRLALDVPGDRAVDPRALVAALRERVPVRHERVTELSRVRAGQVVLAAGAWSGELSGVPVRPVRGQVLRLSGEDLIERSIRTLDAYLVPRGDGTYVLGATMEERGWDPAPTAGGVFELLRDLSEVLPGVLELHLDDVLVGFRPTTPDNRPAIGPAGDGLTVATGHGRNGVLLAPVTADLVAAHLAGEALPDWAASCDPRRFDRVEARA
jgi:glycine oxidase